MLPKNESEKPAVIEYLYSKYEKGELPDRLVTSVLPVSYTHLSQDTAEICETRSAKARVSSLPAVSYPLLPTPYSLLPVPCLRCV